MRLLYNQDWPEQSTTELIVELWEHADENPVYRLIVDGEEDVYFEVPVHCDVIDVIDAAFAARRGVKDA